MAYSLSSERPATAAHSTNLLVALFRTVKKAAEDRRRRRALVNLLSFDDHMLDDIGVQRHDLFDAMQSSRSGQTLAQRRAAASRNWLSP